MTKKPNKETLSNATSPFKRKDGKCPECKHEDCDARYNGIDHATEEEINGGTEGGGARLVNEDIKLKKTKPKLFEDYSEEVRKTKVLPKNVNYFNAVERDTLVNMLNNLAAQIHELNEKVDFVMNRITPPHQDTTRFFYSQDRTATLEVLKPKNLNEIYKETLKKKKKGVKLNHE